MNTCATLTPTLSLAEGEGVVSIPAPPERVAAKYLDPATFSEVQVGG